MVQEGIGTVSPVAATEHRIPLDDVELVAESFGNPDRVPVVLVMGATASMLWWPERLCNLIAVDGYWVIRYDHRDTGASTTNEPGDVDYGAEDLMADLVGVMDGLGIGAAHLVGMSLGGLVNQIPALRHPERVRSLTLATNSTRSIWTRLDRRSCPSSAGSTSPTRCDDRGGCPWRAGLGSPVAVTGLLPR